MRGGGAGIGGPDGSRTRDLLNAIQARSQLRYWPPLSCCEHTILARGRTEPSACGRLRGLDLRLPSVRKREPGREVAGGVLGCCTVERHHGRRHAGRTSQLGAPPVAHGRHLYLVRAPVDGLFETMNRHVYVFLAEEGRLDHTQSQDVIKRSGVRRKGQWLTRARYWDDRAQKKFLAIRLSTVFARCVHRFSTIDGSSLSAGGVTIL